MCRVEWLQCKEWMLEKAKQHNYSGLTPEYRMAFVRRYKQMWDILQTVRLGKRVAK